MAEARAGQVLRPGECSELLRGYDIALPAQRVVSTPEEALAAAGDLGWPVAVKALAPGLVHKSDVGGVALGLTGPAGVRQATGTMAENIADLEGFLVQPMVPGTYELILGIQRDPVLGPFLLVGMGGLWVEVLSDVSIRPLPIDDETCFEMLHELRVAPLLEGERRTPAIDRRALSEMMVALGRLAEDHPEIDQLDLNPVLVTERGPVAVDCSAVVRELPPRGHLRPRPARGVQAILEPKSIVVVGASDDRRKPGGRLLDYLLQHGYGGPLYVVHPTKRKVLGVASYPSVSSLPEAPDLACIALPAAQVLGVLEECVSHGIRGAIVYASGFAETGPEGASEEAALRILARRAHMPICGPNTAGVVNVGSSVCAAITMVFGGPTFRHGGISFLTQSGALGSALLSRMWEQGGGLSNWISCGNEVDLTVGDYLDYLVGADDSTVVAMFLEAIRDLPPFAAACRNAIARGKPVIVYKTGRSELGRQAAASHTAALTGDDALYDAMFRSLGVVRVSGLDELVDSALALERQPPPIGPRVGVVSASGGACGVVADECDRLGLELPRLSESAADGVKELIPSFGANRNPIDVTMGITTAPRMISDVAHLLAREESLDSVLVVLTTNAGAGAVEVARGVVDFERKCSKPVLVSRIGADYLAPEAVALYRASGIPLFPTPERALRALRVMVEVRRSQTSSEVAGEVRS